MLKKRFGGRGMALVTFSVPAEIVIESVHVVGEFNDWTGTATPLARSGGGEMYEATIPIETGRSYRFRYLMDGVRWENDWSADAYVRNEFGGEDSVVDLVGMGAEKSGEVVRSVDRGQESEPRCALFDLLGELAATLDLARHAENDHGAPTPHEAPITHRLPRPSRSGGP